MLPVSIVERRTTTSHKRLADAVCFAHFCLNFQIHPNDAAELMMLLRKYVNAAVKESNEGGEELERKADRARDRFETCAASLGFTDIEWPGYFPTAKHLNHSTNDVETNHQWPTCHPED